MYLYIYMKTLFAILFVLLFAGCTITTGPFYDDLYLSRPSAPIPMQPFIYNPMYWNRYTPYNPYYYQPRYYIVPRQKQQPRVPQQNIQPKTKNAPIRKF